MSKDLIRYDLLVQDALKGVVRKVLGDAARDGLLDDHHFLISFRTDYPGVRLSSRLRERYPQDMTIVLQHQFWDLALTDQAFEVGLSFSGVPERLYIPFDALTGFFDPSVQFGLKFEVDEEAEKPEGTGDKPAPAAKDLAPAPQPIDLQPKKPSVPVTAKSAAPKIAPKQAKPADEPDRRAPQAEKTETGPKPAKEPAKKADEPAAGAEVVSLDAFRKKN